MSAENLLKTIPLELNIITNDNNDYKAFIVLVVFRAMLQKNTNMEKMEKYKKYKNLKDLLKKNMAEQYISHFKGLIYEMFTNEKNQMIISESKNTILFFMEV